MNILAWWHFRDFIEIRTQFKMCSRTRWGRIDPTVQVDLVQGPAHRVLQLDKRTLPRFVQQQLLLMASPSPFLNFLNKFRLDKILINHEFKGVYTMRTSATVTELAAHAWRIMSISDRQPYIRLARKAQQIQRSRMLHFFCRDAT
ncbi:uncharacterized protein LOC117784883 [Drosophila innubila]|uniref:uncharacterized protein LOC117784883 n=1 Tax=Drosophila innubila TaxID=198719 RepID=UPI00148D67A7|nr:uncharacterized protein LOC117784883 [Drosophila innubila]